MRKAVPNAAPIIHIFFVFVSGDDMSDIYACTTQNHAPPIQAIILAHKKIANHIKPSVDHTFRLISVAI
jgi:hypothetical protein